MKTVAVIGAGTIGLSWTTLLLAEGHRVRVSDPRPDLDTAVREAIAQFAPAVPGFTGTAEELLDRVEIVPDLVPAITGADVVQENGPENLEFKQDLFARIEQAAPAEALLLTSTSGLLPSDIGRSMAEPGRVIVGHPFNPPHVLPLVELVPSERTAPQLLQRAEEFYRSLGKVPVTVHKEIRGFVANRLQKALFTECVNLVRQGVVDEAELDEIVTNSVGIRWAAIGPFQAFHLGGGPGGLRHMLAHLMSDIDPDTADFLATQAEELFGLDRYAELTDQRDRRQLAIISSTTDTEGR
ncbi:MAG TPA: 3-hydroxyacyl-CoA dehydrogenase NAD-binding domain-containing protein [Pseudonocardiaceae bacterium]|nr:3-hydroxyacyl-CoA dehydrogenase NAD-binding domain-containing protein [Pseudonocardiaceae bacterium]